MVIIPYSTALRLSKPPIVTYSMTLLCMLIFAAQVSSNITASLLYYPETWNPLKMLTSSLAHGDLFHLMGNMIFYLAFAPALEVLIGNKLKYVWIMVVISFAVSIAYSISTLVSSVPAWPSLGFSGVVTGMIGLSAYLMPDARIRVFWWYLVMWKTFFVPAWILAVIYIGLDSWTMVSADDYGGINVVAHVAGGVTGYLYGHFFLKDRKEEVQDELAHEIKAMQIRQQGGVTRSQAYEYKEKMDERDSHKQEAQAHEKFMARIYQMTSTHRDSEAVGLLLDKYNLETEIYELEQLFERMQEWGPSRSLLCIGRLIIHKLDAELRDGKAIVYIDKCQKISPQFLLGDLSRVLHYAELALQAGRLEVTRNLTVNAEKRYVNLVNIEQCNHLYEKSAR